MEFGMGDMTQVGETIMVVPQTSRPYLYDNVTILDNTVNDRSAIGCWEYHRRRIPFYTILPYYCIIPFRCNIYLYSKGALSYKSESGMVLGTMSNRYRIILHHSDTVLNVVN